MSGISRFELVQQVSVTADGAVVVLRVLKDLTFTNSPQMDGIFHEYLKQGARSIRLDMSRIGFVDSGGLGSLVRLRKALQASGGELAVLNPGRTIQNILRIVGLAPLVRQETLEGEPPSGPAARPAPAPAATGLLDGLGGRAPADGERDDEIEMQVDRLLMESEAAPPPPAAPRAPPAPPPGEQVTMALRESITGANAAVLLDGLLAYLKQGVTTVRLDVHEVGFIDSTGVGMLVRASKAYQGAGARLVLASPGPSLKRIIQLVKLDRVMPIE